MRKLLFESLFRRPFTEQAPSPDDAAVTELATAVGQAARRRLGRSLSIREVDAGSCNGCELEIHALNNAYYDVERFGIRFVASPRHADVLMVTGPVTKNMRDALERTYHATPNPNGSSPWEIAPGMAAALPAAMRWLEGSRSGSRRSSYSRLSSHSDRRCCRGCLLCSIKRRQAPLPLEDLGTTSAIPSRLYRGGHSSRNSHCDDAVGDPFRTISG